MIAKTVIMSLLLSLNNECSICEAKSNSKNKKQKNKNKNKKNIFLILHGCKLMHLWKESGSDLTKIIFSVSLKVSSPNKFEN